MCDLATAAREYFESQGGLWARALSEGGTGVSPELSLRYAAVAPDGADSTPSFSFGSDGLLAYFRPTARRRNRDDEHAGPFTFRSPSQLNLLLEADAPPPDAPEINRELALSHSKVVSELKSALRSDPKFANRRADRPPPPAPPSQPPQITQPTQQVQRVLPTQQSVPPPLRQEPEPDLSFERPKAPEECGFIAKLIGNRKSKAGTDEEKERLVPAEKRRQIVASSDNFFKTDFGGTGDASRSIGESRDCESSTGLEEARALLSGSRTLEGLGASTDSDFLSCEDTPVSAASPTSSTFMLPKTGYDFLDNW